MLSEKKRGSQKGQIFLKMEKSFKIKMLTRKRLKSYFKNANLPNVRIYLETYATSLIFICDRSNKT